MFRFVTPLYNCQSFVVECLRSTKEQSDGDFMHYIVDDCSTDGTWDIVRREIEGDPRYVALRNDYKMCTLYNHIKLMKDFEWDPEDVVLHLDGDDRLSDTQVLSHLKGVYEETGCWVTYGNYEVIPPGTGISSCCAPLQENPNFRAGIWEWSHLRTFKRFLFDKIPYDNFLNEEGFMYTSAPDVALFTPILEMAGKDRIAFSDRVNYHYRMHPSNEHHVPGGLNDQARCAIHYRTKESFKTL